MFNIIKYEINFILFYFKFIEESMKAGESVQTLEYVNVIVIIIYKQDCSINSGTCADVAFCTNYYEK